MKSVQRVGAALMILLILSTAMGQETQTTSLPLGTAMVADFKGDFVLHSPQGQVLEGQRGLVLQPGSVIETAKGSTLLQLQDGSQVLVKPNSHVLIEDPAGGQGFFFQMMIGKIIAKIQKRLGETPSFRMGTPTAVITVRGTQFSVEVNKKQKTYVEVYEGVVEVEGTAPGSRPVLIQPGYSTQVSMNRGPDQPRGMGPGGEGRDGSRDSSGRGGDDRSTQGTGHGGDDDHRQRTGSPPPPQGGDRDH
jgi:FecR protein